MGMPPDILGRGASESFGDADAKGRALRVWPARATSTPDDRTSQEVALAENSFELGANLGLVSVGARVSADERRRVLRTSVYHVSRVDTLVREGPAATDAPFVAVRVLYGWAFHRLVEGDQRTFTASMAARLQKEVGLQAQASRSGLSVKQVMIGLDTPASGTEFITSVEQALRSLRPASSGPVPIFVEYEALRATRVPRIRWAREPFVPGDWTLAEVQVTIAESKKNGDSWDAGGGLPDPLVQLEIGGRRVETMRKSDACEATFKPGRRITLGEVLQLRLIVYDKDVMFDDYVGEAEAHLMLDGGMDAAEPIVLRTSGALRQATIRFEPVGGRGQSSTDAGQSCLNETTYLCHALAALWHFELGGYPVLKKGLGYHQAARLGGGPPMSGDVGHFRSIAHRLAAVDVRRSGLQEAQQGATADASTASRWP